MSTIEQVIPYGKQVNGTYDPDNFTIWDPETHIKSFTAAADGVHVVYEPQTYETLWEGETDYKVDDDRCLFAAVTEGQAEDYEDWAEEFGRVTYNGQEYILFFTNDQD